MSNVLLLYPRWHFMSKERYLPHSMLFVASVLREEHDVKFLDLRVSDFSEAHLNWADYLCLSVGTPQIDHALEISQTAKETGLATIWGGLHGTILKDQTIGHKLVDIIVRGQGEATIKELLHALENGTDLSAIDGISWKKDSVVVHNKERMAPKLATIPDPAFDLINPRKYLNSDRHLGDRVIDVNSSRGCPHRCAFCYITSIYRLGYWDGFPPERIVSWIEYLNDKCHITGFKFQDDEFFVRKTWVEDICNRLMENGHDFKWATSARIDYAYRWGDDFLALIAKAGCRRIQLGIESGSQRILDMMKKDIKVEQIIPAIEKIKKHGIAGMCSFMIAPPSETKEDLYATWKLMNEIKKIDPNSITRSVNMFTPYPGTELYELCIRMGWKQPEQLEEWGSLDLQRDLYDYPWVPQERREFLRLILLAMDASMNPTKLALPYRFVTNLRLKSGYYGFPIELKLMTKLGKMYMRAKTKKLHEQIDKRAEEEDAVPQEITVKV